MNPCAQSPESFTIETHKNADRLKVSQVCTIIKCLVGLGPKQLSVGFRSPPQGSAGDRWMEVSAENYLLGFWVNDFASGGSIAECFYCSSPKGSEWFAPQDQGKPFGSFSANEIEIINRLLYVGWPEDDVEVLVAQLWRVALRVKGGGISFAGGAWDKGPCSDGTIFPKELLGHASFGSRGEAEIVRTRYADYRKKKLADERNAKENPISKKKK